MNSIGTKAFVQICAVTVLLIPNALMAASPAAAAAPARSNLSPEAQQESDWVDARWNQTEVGPFLASSLSIAGALPGIPGSPPALRRSSWPAT